MMSTIEDIKRAAERAGNPWFGPVEEGGFGTRLSATVYPLRDLDPLQYPAGTLLENEEMTVFVTSERDRYRHDNPRLYTVRLAIAGTTRRESDGREVPTFDVLAVSEFGEYASLSGAHGRAKRYAQSHPRALNPQTDPTEAFDMVEITEQRPVGPLTEANSGPVGTVDIARGDYWARVWPGCERDREGLPEEMTSWRFEIGFVCPKDGHDLDGPATRETFGGWRKGARYVLCGGNRLTSLPSTSAWLALRGLLLELHRNDIGRSWTNGWEPDDRAAAWSREAVAAINTRL